MESNEEITITIGVDGEPTIAVSGVSGQSCKSLTIALEKALGNVTSDEKTGEFYERERATVRRNNNA